MRRVIGPAALALLALILLAFVAYVASDRSVLLALLLYLPLPTLCFAALGLDFSLVSEPVIERATLHTRGRRPRGGRLRDSRHDRARADIAHDHRQRITRGGPRWAGPCR